MIDAVNDLTDKEKEALRLLLAGHDAKSSASTLELSVHTINDRLRNARRKLGVSSSREAARILGDTEGEIPQSDVHKPFGVLDPAGGAQDTITAHQSGEGSSSSVWRSKGLIVMIFATATASLALAISGSGDSAPGAAAEEQAETSVSDSAAPSATLQDASSANASREWLALVDRADAAVSYAEAGEPLRDQYSAQIWDLGVALRKNNFGLVERRRLLQVDTRSALADGAQGDFEILVYETDFARCTDATETVTLQRIDGRWRVVGYDLEDQARC